MSSRKVLIVLLPIIAIIITVITMLWVIGYAFHTWPTQQYVELMRVTVWPVTFLQVPLVFIVGALLLIYDRERPLSFASTPQTTEIQFQQAPQQETAEMQSRVFNHALYHLVTHWLAVVTLIALLIGVPGVLSAVSQPHTYSKWPLTYSIFAATLMCIYFLLRMKQFGEEVNRNGMLSSEYLKRTRFLPGNWNFVLGAIIVLLAFCMDIYIVWGS